MAINQPIIITSIGIKSYDNNEYRTPVIDSR